MISNEYKSGTGRENWKIHKCMEIKYTPEQTVVQRLIKNRNKNILKQMKMEIQHSKTCVLQQKERREEVYGDKCLP